MNRFKRCLIGLTGLTMLQPGLLAAETNEAGRILAETHCARCHAIGKTGDSQLEAAPPFREVVTRYPVESLAEALAEGIVVGHEAMPEFSFSQEEIADFLAYMNALKD